MTGAERWVTRPETAGRELTPGSSDPNPGSTEGQTAKMMNGTPTDTIYGNVTMGDKGNDWVSTNFSKISSMTHNDYIDQWYIKSRSDTKICLARERNEKKEKWKVSQGNRPLSLIFERKSAKGQGTRPSRENTLKGPTQNKGGSKIRFGYLNAQGL